MKANAAERKKFDKALDDILELFNDLEDDQPVVRFDEAIVEQIGKAKRKFGAREVDTKINTVVREMLSWLDLDEVEEEPAAEEQ
ncbi:MAG TPA: hypothetical protein VFK44_13665 [Bacillales bacterium]|nr:hypothetical protein [Bacillales bacterium]